MSEVFHIKLSSWKETLDAYMLLEYTMAQKIEEQYHILEMLESCWKGDASYAFRTAYKNHLEMGSYAQAYLHVQRMRNALEFFLPDASNLTWKCEELASKLDEDSYFPTYNRCSDELYHNAGEIFFEEGYLSWLVRDCDRILELNQQNRKALEEILNECDDIMDVSDVREMVRKACNKIARVENYKKAVLDLQKDIQDFEERVTEYFGWIEQDTGFTNERVKQVTSENSVSEEPQEEGNWYTALVDKIFDSKLADVLFCAMADAIFFVPQQTVSMGTLGKSYYTEAEKNSMRTKEVQQHTADFINGVVKSVPLVAGELVEGCVDAVCAIPQIPSAFKTLAKTIEENGILAVADSIWDNAIDEIKTTWDEEFVHGTAEQRGEMAGRILIEVIGIVFAAYAGAVKATSAGSKATKTIANVGDTLDDVSDALDTLSDTVKAVDKVEDVAQTLDKTHDTAKTIDKIEDVVDGLKGGVYADLDAGLNFSNKALEHMGEVGRQVPVQTLQDAIKYGEAMPDPRGSSATMYYTIMYKNGRKYNLEVLYDELTNKVYHFEYARKAMGKLPAVSK